MIIAGARHNNLKHIDVAIPLNRFVCVTGVSGSGKSSLVSDILWPGLAQRIHRSAAVPGGHDELRGIKQLDKVINVDQAPIGSSPHSNAATYTGVFDLIRELFARLPDSKIRGYTANRFSFNRPGGRCDVCEGQGQICHEMHFLPDVWVSCDACKGARYNPQTLEVRFRARHIADVLDMTVAEALEHFHAIPKIKRLLTTLNDVGLGYLPLGQSAPTLSGGEAQRVKLAAELGRPHTGRTIYLLDEPTTGLHVEDLRKLLDVLHRLVDLGNTVVCIEHNLDVIKTADWIIDLGPEAGDDGGHIVAQGTPEQVAAVPASHTGRALKPILDRGPHEPRQRFDPSQERETPLKHAATAAIELADAGQLAMPWTRNGRRWHLEQRPSREGESVKWQAAALEFVVDQIERQAAESFAPTDWKDRARVEITAAGKNGGKSSGLSWFFHALTGGRWLLDVSFRVPRGTFKRPALVTALNLETLNDRDDLPVYGGEQRVHVRPIAGDLDNVRIQIHDKAEINTPGFRRFIKAAVRAYRDHVESMNHDAAAAKPWEADGRTWHLSQKAMSPRAKPQWKSSTLIDLLGRMGRALPSLTPVWNQKTRIELRTRAGRIVGRIWTASARGLKLELLTPPGRIAPAELQDLGHELSIERGRDGRPDKVVCWLRTGADVRHPAIPRLLKQSAAARRPVATDA
ncbi:MAG: hypothetical protein V3T70_02120 [Phycisphaerae bacterium]